MSKYVFIHKTEDGGKVLHSIQHNLCVEVVRNFYYFLRGVSFHNDTIVAAFATIVDEYEDKDNE